MHRRATARGALVGVAAVVGLIVVAGLVVGLVAVGGAADTQEDVATPVVDSEALAQVRPSGPILVRAVDRDDVDGDGQVFSIAPDGQVSAVGNLRCKRVAAAPGGGGLCLAVARNGLDYDAVVFDGAGRRGLTRPVDGLPSRARVSRDGRYGAFTSFPLQPGQVPGYARDTADFTTTTRVIDLDSGEVALNPDKLDIRRNGRPVSTEGAEYWGFTFGDGGRYYATAAVRFDRVLIKGKIGDRRADVVHEIVECPSLAPDQTRIAYKRPVLGSGNWELYVLDLETLEETPLAELRSIDDQPEWLNDDWIAYSDGRAVFATRADGKGQPVRLARFATSPAVAAGGSR